MYRGYIGMMQEVYKDYIVVLDVCKDDLALIPKVMAQSWSAHPLFGKPTVPRCGSKQELPGCCAELGV